MSVIVKGMEVQIKCEDCPCAYFTEGAWNDFCQVTHDEIIDKNKRLDSCPLKSIDGLIEKIEEYWNECDDLLQAPSLRGTREVIKEYCEVNE